MLSDEEDVQDEVVQDKKSSSSSSSSSSSRSSSSSSSSSNSGNSSSSISAEQLQCTSVSPSSMALSENFSPLQINALVGLRAELTCSICTQIFDDPQTLLCSHAFCLSCIV